MTVLELSAGSLARADELLDKACHDVAKYMALSARNVDPASASEREASYIRRDLLQTHGSSPAWVLWQPLSEALRQILSDERISEIDRGMERLESLLSGEEQDLEIEALVALVVDVSDRIVRLRREVRRRRMEVEL